MTILPSSFGYNHLRAHFVEFQPQFSFMEKHFDPFHALDEGEKSHTDKPRGSRPLLPKLPPNTEMSPPSLWSLWGQRLQIAPSPLQSCLGQSTPAQESPYMFQKKSPRQDYRKLPNHQGAPECPVGRLRKEMKRVSIHFSQDATEKEKKTPQSQKPTQDIVMETQMSTCKHTDICAFILTMVVKIQT